MHKKIEELQKDFSQMLENVNMTSYNPLSNDFQKLANIGLMWLILSEMEEEVEEKMEDDYEKVKDELMGAETYFDMYSKEKDPTLKSLASDELRHALYFLNKIRLENKTSESKNHYMRLKTWYDDLLNKIHSPLTTDTEIFKLIKVYKQVKE